VYVIVTLQKLIEGMLPMSVPVRALTWVWFLTLSALMLITSAPSISGKEKVEGWQA
jgi:hypothetical protein